MSDEDMDVQGEENVEQAPDEEEVVDDHPEMWKDPRVENIIRVIRKNEKAKNKNEIIKVNYKVLIDPKTKLIAPFVTLLGTSVIAIFTYFDNMPTEKWYIAVCVTVVLFLLFGAVLQHMIEKYEEEAVKSWIERRLEQERLKDEERARKEAEALIAQAQKAVKEEEDMFF